MSEINNKYKRIIKDIESNITDEKQLEFVKEKVSELSMLFIDIIDRLTELTDMRIKKIEQEQKEIGKRIQKVQTAVDGIENDIYEDDSYEFQIVCPYCNYEFTTDIENEAKEEIECPECHNVIELDWNQDEEEIECGGSCSHCLHDCVAETPEEYNVNNNHENEDEEDDNEDM